MELEDLQNKWTEIQQTKVQEINIVTSFSFQKMMKILKLFAIGNVQKLLNSFKNVFFLLFQISKESRLALSSGNASDATLTEGYAKLDETAKCGEEYLLKREKVLQIFHGIFVILRCKIATNCYLKL